MRGVTGSVCRRAASDRGGSPDRVESSARCEPGVGRWRTEVTGVAMTATRASLKGIGNIFPIALSLLIAACGGGGGGGGGGGTTSEPLYLFPGSSDGTDYEPWKSDGTEAGTVLVKN